MCGNAARINAGPRREPRAAPTTPLQTLPEGDRPSERSFGGPGRGQGTGRPAAGSPPSANVPWRHVNRRHGNHHANPKYISPLPPTTYRSPPPLSRSTGRILLTGSWPQNRGNPLWQPMHKSMGKSRKRKTIYRTAHTRGQGVFIQKRPSSPLKHGLLAEDSVIPGEDPGDFDRHLTLFERIRTTLCAPAKPAHARIPDSGNPPASATRTSRDRPLRWRSVPRTRAGRVERELKGHLQPRKLRRKRTRPPPTRRGECDASPASKPPS